MDYQLLSKELDKVKIAIYTNKFQYSVFLGALLSDFEVIWDENQKTAGIGQKYIYWNPQWFLSLPKDARVAVMCHELWHAGRAHLLRLGNKNKKLWNMACDIKINRDLRNSGYIFDPFVPLFGDTIPDVDDMPEEKIYDYLLNHRSYNSDLEEEDSGIHNGTDFVSSPITPEMLNHELQNLVRATQITKMQNGSVPGDIITVITKLTTPKIQWSKYLQLFIADLAEKQRSYARQSRRSTQVILPTTKQSFNGIKKVVAFIDVSGSIALDTLQQYLSEIRYILLEKNINTFLIIPFDYTLRKEISITRATDLRQIQFVGGGGTSFHEITEYLNNNLDVSAVIIFTDLYATPMVKPNRHIPILWGVSGDNPEIPLFGTVARI